MDILGKDLLGNITDAELESILSEYGEVQKDDNGKITGIKTDKGYEIAIEDIWSGTTVAKEDNKTEEVVVESGANVPDIDGFAKNTTSYVTWSSNTAEPTEILMSGTEPTKWYDYTAGKNEWANVKTSANGNDCYWVWIPRYAYKVPVKTTPATIEVKFLQGDTNIPIGETTPITNTTPTPGEWVVHPAFTVEGNGGLGNLTGIWVAKFEASSSSQTSNFINNDNAFTTALADTNSTTGYGGANNINLQVRVIPNVVSWRYISVSNIYTVCQNMKNGTGTLSGANRSRPAYDEKYRMGSSSIFK